MYGEKGPFKGMLPRSKRFCINCKQVRMFILDEQIGHSRCKVCKGVKSIEVNNKTKIVGILKNQSYVKKQNTSKKREDPFSYENQVNDFKRELEGV